MQKTLNGNVLILKMQEVVLIKNSEEAKNVELYGNLFSALEPYIKLSKSNLDKDIVFDDKARLALLNNKDTLMKNVNAEWYAIENSYISDKEEHCQLCGAKNTYVCWIKNRKNGNELHVGRECVKNYTNINGAKIVLGKINKAERDMKKEARRVEFELKQDEDVNFLQEAENKLDDYPMMMPIKIYQALKSSLSTCNRLKRSYVNNNGNIDDIFEKFESSRKQFESLYSDALKYYQTVNTNPLICDRRMSKWVQQNAPNMEAYIRERKGMFDEVSLKFIYDSRFCEEKLFTFKKAISDDDLNIINIEGSVIRFAIKNKLFFQPVTFTMKLSEFMRNIGCFCLTNKTFVYNKKKLRNVTVEETSTNFHAVYNSISSILRKYEYDFIIDDRTSQAFWEKKQTLGSTSKWSKHKEYIQPVYKKTSIHYLLAMVTSIILEDADEILRSPRKLIAKIENSGQWITKNEKEKSVRIAASAAGMQKQKEFTPYL